MFEYVEGPTLGELQKSKHRLPAEEAAGYILQAARGLRFAHQHGMIHGDVNADNILVSEQGVVKVADLGLARGPTTDQLPTADARS